MPSTSVIVLNHLTYAFSSDKPLIQALSLVFGREKSGLVGKNGVGKSTLVRLILGELPPGSGTVQIDGNIAYCPQEFILNPKHSIADALGISTKLRALERIVKGSVELEDFAVLNEDWQIKERVTQQLVAFGLAHLHLERPLAGLSGGERTRLHLAKCFLQAADFIILDEPTNNLDSASRRFLYQAITAWQGGLLVISHDRKLLNLMHRIVELTGLGATIYGGNYDDYAEQKALILAANERSLLDAQKALRKTEDLTQARHEKTEQKQSYGRKLFKTGKIDRLTANSKKGRSEKTQSRHAKLNENLLEQAKEQLDKAKSKIETCHEINIKLPKTFVPNGKSVLRMEAVSFAYSSLGPDQTPSLLINNFTLQITGAERLALCGQNGSGKTTLVKLILGELKPTQGEIYIGVERVNYLDQTTSLLDAELSVLANFLQLNPDVTETEARFFLADFLFRNTLALKLVKQLSGGEKLRALLACVLMSKNPPQLLILDEPTNHLDFASMASIESALRHYQGALLIISHDEKFLENTGVTRMVTAPFTNSGIKFIK